MVKKLYKYEFLALFRWILPINGVCLLMALLLRGAIALNRDLPENSVSNIVVGLLTVTFIISVIGASVAAFWLVIVRFYKHMLSHEGYLTFTIPISPTTHLVCKLVCGCVVSVISSVAVVGSLAIIMTSFDMSSVFETLESFGVYISDMKSEFIAALLLLVISGIVSLVLGLVMPYTAMCLGQMAKKNKILMSVVWYIILSAVMSIVSEIINVIMVVFTAGTFEEPQYVSLTETLRYTMGVFNTFMIFPMLTSVAFSVAFFLIARYILNNKLNLE